MHLRLSHFTFQPWLLATLYHQLVVLQLDCWSQGEPGERMWIVGTTHLGAGILGLYVCTRIYEAQCILYTVRKLLVNVL